MDREETFTYICEFCQNTFIPKRRKIQRFCSATCRSKNWFHNHKLPKEEKKELTIQRPETKPTIAKIEQVSTAGVTNAALGTALVELGKVVLTPASEKAVTKKDFEELKTFIKGKYLPITNMHKDNLGRSPFYDTVAKSVVYLIEQTVSSLNK